jgi:hypothetical protein
MSGRRRITDEPLDYSEEFEIPLNEDADAIGKQYRIGEELPPELNPPVDNDEDDGGLEELDFN